MEFLKIRWCLVIFFVEIIWRNSFFGVLVVSVMYIKFMDLKYLIVNRYVWVCVFVLELKVFIILL